MKTVKFNKDSWHYKLAEEVDSYYPSEDADLCSYIRTVMKSIFIVALMATLVGALFTGMSILAVHAIFGVVYSIIYKTFMFTEPGVVGLIFLAIATIVGSVKFATIYVSNMPSSPAKPEKPDGFISTAYGSWKHKYCARVEFIQEDNT